MVMHNNFWGCLIAELRTTRKISQRQLSAQAKVNRSTLRRIEEGTARGDIDIIERILNFLGYELEALTNDSVEERAKKKAVQQADPSFQSKQAASSLLTMTLISK